MDKWLNFQNDADYFIVKFCLDSTAITCWLSDFKILWTESLDIDGELLNRFKADNPLFDDVDKVEDNILKTMCHLPSNPSNILLDKVNDETDKITLRFINRLEDSIPLKFHWKLEKCNSQTFFNVITKALMRQVFDLNESNKVLMEMVKNKDLEIAQHKLEGAQPLTRKQFITKPFDAEEHSKRFSNTVVTDEFLNQFGFDTQTIPSSSEKESQIREEQEENSLATVSITDASKSKPVVNRGRKRNIYQPIVPLSKVEYSSSQSDAEIEESTVPQLTNTNLIQTKRNRKMFNL